MNDLINDIEYRITRMHLYNETYTDWVSYLTDLKTEMESILSEYERDECRSADQISDLAAESARNEISDRDARIKELENKIKSLEVHIDTIADLPKKRAKLARAMTVSEARACFRVVS